MPKCNWGIVLGVVIWIVVIICGAEWYVDYRSARQAFVEASQGTEVQRREPTPLEQFWMDTSDSQYRQSFDAENKSVRMFSTGGQDE